MSLKRFYNACDTVRGVLPHSKNGYIHLVCDSEIAHDVIYFYLGWYAIKDEYRLEKFNEELLHG